VNSAGHQLGSFFAGFAAGPAPAVLLSGLVSVCPAHEQIDFATNSLVPPSVSFPLAAYGFSLP
jgi:hypothetical protein